MSYSADNQFRAMGRSFRLQAYGLGLPDSRGVWMPYALPRARQILASSTACRLVRPNLSLEDNHAPL